MDNPITNICPTCFEALESSRDLCQRDFKKLMDLLVFLMGFEIEGCNNQFNICSKCSGTLEEILKYQEKFRESYQKFRNSKETKTADLIDPNSRLKCDRNNSRRVKKCQEIVNDTNSNSDADYTPPAQTLTDSDSSDDNELLIHLTTARTKQKSKSEADIENNLKNNTQIHDVPYTKTKRRTKARIQQYPVKDVIEAIAEATSYMTDIKNRVCLHCDFTSNLVKGLYHHMRKHKEVYPQWCARCNIQTEDLEHHQDATKCSTNECKFCGRLNKNIYVLTEHLRCHSRAAFFVNDKNKDMDSDDIEDMQNELNQKPVSQIRKRGPYKKIKSYECDPTSSSDESGDSYRRRSKKTKQKPNDDYVQEDHEWSDDNSENDDDSNDNDEFKQESDGNLTPTRQNPYKAGIPLQQFPPEEVQRALTDAMRPFYNARRCPQCAFLTKNISSLQRHIQPCHKEIYEKWCNDCNKIIFDNLKEHKKAHREDLLKCPFCGASRKSRDHLKKHLTNHCCSDRKLIHGVKWYSCDKCPCSYPVESDLKDHICTEEPPLHLYTYKAKEIADETSESNATVKKTKMKRRYRKKVTKSGWKNRRLFPFCVFCKKTVRSLQDHLVLKHGYEPTESKKRPSKFEEPHHGKEKSDALQISLDDQEYRGPKCTKFRYCNICERNVRYIRDHMKRFHSDLPKRSYLCSACGKTFVSSTSLQAHTKFVHNSQPAERSLKCSTCGKSLGNLATLKVHEKLHVTKKSHACHLCGVCFIDNSQLRSHLKTHIGEDHGPVYCSVCNKKFLRPALLDLHMQKFHTGQDPYKCMICFKVLTRMGSLKQHMKYVHGEHEDLKCKYCGKELRSPGTLKKHELIHIGVKPYKCSVCSFSCRQSNGLTSHMKQHPEDLPQDNCPHKCAFCYRRFNTKAMLTSHITLRHKNEQIQKEN